MFEGIVGNVGELRTDITTSTVYRYNGTEWIVNGTGSPSSAGLPTTNVVVGEVREDFKTGGKYRWSGTEWVLQTANKITKDNLDTSLHYLLDTVFPTLISDNINILSNSAGTGILIFSENVILSGLSMVKAIDDSAVGGSVSVSSGTGTQNITLNITTPNLSGEFVKIIGTATDKAGNAKTFESSYWEL